MGGCECRQRCGRHHSQKLAALRGSCSCCFPSSSLRVMRLCRATRGGCHCLGTRNGCRELRQATCMDAPHGTSSDGSYNAKEKNIHYSRHLGGLGIRSLPAVTSQQWRENRIVRKSHNSSGRQPSGGGCRPCSRSRRWPGSGRQQRCRPWTEGRCRGVPALT